MPVSYIPSAKDINSRQKLTARKRLRNQNTEIEELAGLLPIKHPSLSNEELPPFGKPQPVDKVSVLRLTSAYLKLQSYLEDNDTDKSKSSNSLHSSVADLFTEALDNFLLVLDGEGTILFASESITGTVGLTQHDVIGQNLADITEDEDAAIITENLQPKTTPLSPNVKGHTELQQRLFYVRIKSAVTPGRMQLSRFKSHIMIQISGSLKVFVEFQTAMIPNGKQHEPIVLGFVGECCLIESSSSILEISVPQSNFTSTITMDMRIISVDASVTDVVGYNPDDFIGTRMYDYFHPGDCQQLSRCVNMLMHLKHGVSPVSRFMASNGSWVWLQMEAVVRCKQDTDEPQFCVIKAKLISQHEGETKYIECKELYAASMDPDQNMMCPYRDQTVTAALCSYSERKCIMGSEDVIESLRNAEIPNELMDCVLHGREMSLKQLPRNMEPVLRQSEADDFVMKRDLEMGLSRPHYSSQYLSFNPSSQTTNSMVTDMPVGVDSLHSSPLSVTDTSNSVSSLNSVTSPPSVGESCLSGYSHSSPQSISSIISPGTLNGHTPSLGTPYSSVSEDLLSSSVNSPASGASDYTVSTPDITHGQQHSYSITNHTHMANTSLLHQTTPQPSILTLDDAHTINQAHLTLDDAHTINQAHLTLDGAYTINQAHLINGYSFSNGHMTGHMSDTPLISASDVPSLPSSAFRPSQQQAFSPHSMPLPKSHSNISYTPQGETPASNISNDNANHHYDDTLAMILSEVIELNSSTDENITPQDAISIECEVSGRSFSGFELPASAPLGNTDVADLLQQFM